MSLASGRLLIVAMRRAMVLAVFAAMLPSVTQAATISINSSLPNTTGNFTLTWPSGYELRLSDASWRYAAPPATSQPFTDLPSGVYTFKLTQCAYVPPPYGAGWTCYDDPASTLAVEVRRDNEPAIDTSPAGAGTTAYSANTTPRGSSQVVVPIRTIPGVNGHAPELALVYDSARGSDISEQFFTDDDLGHGWRLAGLSRIHRCRLGLSGGGAPTLGATDALCIDGQLLKVVSGSYWADNSVYRTETQAHIQVTQKPGDWFEVRYPDGSVGIFGDTANSKVIGGGQYTGVYMWSQPSPTFVWALRQKTSSLNYTWSVTYESHAGYGFIQPKSISYTNAEIEFKYWGRSDTATAFFAFSGGYSFVRRTSLLHTVRVKMNGQNVREYRLDNNIVGSQNRLEKIQECGYASSGGSITCLRPLLVEWSAVNGGTGNFPIAVSALTDGMGARTEFYYSAITSSSNPLTYGEAPYGTPPANPVNLTAQPIAAVGEMRRSNGINSGASNRWTYGYKTYAYQDSLNRGYLGFHETRVKDEQTGIVRYTQHRLDGILKGAPSQIREYPSTFPSSQLLSRREITYQLRALPGGLTVPLVTRDTRWLLETNFTYGATETEYNWCFTALSGNSCPTYSTTDLEHPTQLYVLSQTGDTISVEPPASNWGDVQNHTLSNVRQTSQTIMVLQNTSSPWIKALPIKRINYETAAGQSMKTVVDDYQYFSGTAVPMTRILRNNDTATRQQWSQSLHASNLPAVECLEVTAIGCVATWFGSTYADTRYPTSVTNAAGHQSQFTWDSRFGVPETAVDPDGRTSEMSYDSFGRLVQETQPDQTTTTISYQRCDVVSCAAVSGAIAAMKITVSVSHAFTFAQLAPTTARYVDVLGRTVLEETQALDPADGWRRVRTVYDSAGRVKFVSRPYFSTQTMPDCAGAAGPGCTWLTYDVRNRVVREDRPDGGYTLTSWSTSAGSVTAVSTESIVRPGDTTTTMSRQNSFNVLGQLWITVDALGNSTQNTTTQYGYDSHGNLASVSSAKTGDPLKVIATMTYDLAGNRKTLNDANTGNYSYDFDNRGLVTLQTDGKLQKTLYQYDVLGRVQKRYDVWVSGTTADVTNTWNWDPANAKGQLASMTNGGFSETYTYNTDGKLSGVSSVINVPGVSVKTHNRSFTYDSSGRLSTIGYPNLTVTHGYSSRGYLTQYLNGSTVLDEVTDTDAFGNVTEQRFNGAAVRTSRTFDTAMGRLQTIRTGDTALPARIQDLVYTWQSNSSLLKRKDFRLASDSADDTTDTYGYDELGRLLSQVTTPGANGSPMRTLTNTYDVFGNLLTKTSNQDNGLPNETPPRPADLDITGYAYDTAKPHRLLSVNIGGVGNALSYDGNGSITTYDAATGDDSYLEYDGQNNVKRVTVGTSPNTTTPKARDEFWYTPEGDRYLGRETWNASGTMRTAVTTYLGAYEEVAPASNSGYNLFQRVQITPTVQWTRRTTAGGGSAWFYRLLHRDHLGSVDAITNSSGSLISSAASELSFDPFGGRRSKDWKSDVNTDEVTALLFIDYEDENSPRGFTDHEMLNRTGFIHMNGRVYDPRIGRFVSADPYVQAPTFSQSWNRYAYVFNDPVSLVDPSGFCSQTGNGNDVVGVRCPHTPPGGLPIIPAPTPPGVPPNVNIPGWTPNVPVPERAAGESAEDYMNRIAKFLKDWFDKQCGERPCDEPAVRAIEAPLPNVDRSFAARSIVDYINQVSPWQPIGKFKFGDAGDGNSAITNLLVPGQPITISEEVYDKELTDKQHEDLFDTLWHENIHRMLSIRENLRLGREHPEVYGLAGTFRTFYWDNYKAYFRSLPTPGGGK